MQIRGRWFVLEAWALALAVYATMTGGTGLREDELLCEEALARLEDCCPPEDLAEIKCSYDHACYNSATYPDIGPEDSRCIREASCETLRARGLCERLRTGTMNRDDYFDLQVCP